MTIRAVRDANSMERERSRILAELDRIRPQLYNKLGNIIDIDGIGREILESARSDASKMHARAGESVHKERDSRKTLNVLET
mmetsp:Transcript_20575/g.28756  ORF Transcript_20575/g.28756 Transcript_20575/m.28756 type:complete len:82 (-) Transcript_20575:37-282(-)